MIIKKHCVMKIKLEIEKYRFCVCVCVCVMRRGYNSDAIISYTKWNFIQSVQSNWNVKFFVWEDGPEVKNACFKNKQTPLFHSWIKTFYHHRAYRIDGYFHKYCIVFASPPHLWYNKKNKFKYKFWMKWEKRRLKTLINWSAGNAIYFFFLHHCLSVRNDVFSHRNDCLLIYIHNDCQLWLYFNNNEKKNEFIIWYTHFKITWWFPVIDLNFINNRMKLSQN